MGAALRDGDSEAGPARRETAADRREWAAMCRQVRVPTMWGIPLRLFLLALGAVLPALDRALAPPHTVAVRRRRRAPRGDVVLAVNIPRLLDCEGAWGMRIELVPSLGTPVPSGGFLFRTSAPVGRAQCRALESALAFGDVLAPASGPFGAIRAMVDIALKALSPAVNDPSRAAQALEEIEDILAEPGPTSPSARRSWPPTPTRRCCANGRAAGPSTWPRPPTRSASTAPAASRSSGGCGRSSTRSPGSASSSSERPCSSAARRFTVGSSAGGPIRSTADWPVARIPRAWAGRSAQRRAPSRPRARGSAGLSAAAQPRREAGGAPVAAHTSRHFCASVAAVS
ncbi:Predicted membrane protein (DUF2254) [Brevibacterium linens]|uniref:Predicted membrane protein (DUF2254) n=1 Tax=Brevibacterium linens TaxID=1703 RepID=A0A2H1JZF7_BRELN|nr:Predicted membrane protein (DUF2254) [Brevibacterium linens]